MPTPREAIATLRSRFPSLAPQPPDPADGQPPDDLGAPYYSDPTGALELSSLRDEQAGELQDRLTRNEAAAMIPQEGYVQGEPGRRMVSRVAASNAFEDARKLKQLDAEAAADPFTGVAEQARTKATTDTLDAAARVMRPEVGDAAETVARRNAFADYMKSRGMKMGEYEAAASPAAQAAAEVPLHAQASDVGERLANEKLDRENKAADEKLRREKELRMSPALAVGQVPYTSAGGTDASGLPGGGGESVSIPGTIPGYTLPPNLKPFTAEGERAMNAMRQGSSLLGELEPLLDPNKAEIPNRLGQSAKWALYKMGVTDSPFSSTADATERARNQARLQLASMITIIGSAPFIQGSRNYQRIKDIEKHLTNPAASDAFLWSQVQELKHLWPIMQREMIIAHVNPGAALDFGAADMTDPNRGMEGR
jgi:hypothetical protein